MANNVSNVKLQLVRVKEGHENECVHLPKSLPLPVCCALALPSKPLPAEEATVYAVGIQFSFYA